MSGGAWLHPLTRASRMLTVHLQDLERALPVDDKSRVAWPQWDDYVRTCDVLTRVIALTRGGTVEPGPWQPSSQKRPRAS
jgi:hypothetical protein